MCPVTRARLVLPFAAVLLAVLGAAPSAQACLFSNVASAYADNALAHRVTTLPTSARGRALWAPFAFARDFAPGRAVHLREDMREVAQSQGQDALHWRVHWLFGDGTRASGVAVTHTYRRPGLYRIEVQGNFVGSSGLKGWYAFDVVDIAVGAVPADLRALIGSARSARGG